MAQSKPFRRTAVVVEDDAIQRDMIALLLEESDFNVIQCEDAETALLAITARRTCLLVTDVGLAGRMDGVELARRARSLDRAMRVVVISGRPPQTEMPDDIAFYAKPVYPIDLLREASR